jgi:hypothetical protein
MKRIPTDRGGLVLVVCTSESFQQYDTVLSTHVTFTSPAGTFQIASKCRKSHPARTLSVEAVPVCLVDSTHTHFQNLGVPLIHLVLYVCTRLINLVGNVRVRHPNPG